METNQIYALVNSIAKQTIGTEAITVTDTSTLVALGTKILSSTVYVENFFNTLIQRIGRTIISYRKYDSKLRGLVKDDMEWGAIVQKIKVDMPEFIEDKSYDLTDGASVDMYIVQKPKVKQYFFAIRTPYSCYITLQDWQLKEAFTSASTMGSFVSAIFGEVQNKLELTVDNLGRLTMANYMALTGTAQRIHLLTQYNAINGTNLTAEQAKLSEPFLRYAIGQMNLYSNRLENMSVLYNTEGETRHTPKKLQTFAIIDEIEMLMQTQVQYAAFHDEYVKREANISVPYWQSAQSPYDINLAVKDSESEESATKNVELKNIVAFLFDKEALGTFRQEEAVLTTPMNARGRYVNTFWHEKQLWFNDLSENGIIFLLD